MRGNMKTVLGIALIAGTGYYLLRDQIAAMFGSGSAGTTTTPASGAGSSPAPGTPTAGPSSGAAQTPSPTTTTQAPAPAPPAPAPAVVTTQMLYAAATTDAGAQLIGNYQLTADQWNWYYSQATGVQQTADLFTPNNRGELITATEYRRRRAAMGLAGIRRAAWGR